MTKRTKYTANALAAAMKRKGMSPTQLAAKLDLSEMSVRRYLAGARIPKLERLREIGTILGVEWR